MDYNIIVHDNWKVLIGHKEKLQHYGRNIISFKCFDSYDIHYTGVHSNNNKSTIAH